MSTASIAPTPSHSALSANLICMASMLSWAAALPAAEFLIGRIPMVEMVALRVALAALCLLPVWYLAEGRAALRKAAWGRGTLIGTLFALAALTMLWSQSLTDAVTFAIISTTLPICSLLIEVALDGRRITAALLLGVALSIIGGIVAYSAGLGDFGLGLGALVGLVSNIIYAIASRLAVSGLPGMTALGRTTLSLSGAAVMAGIAALVHTGLTGGAGWGEIGLTQVAALAIYAIFGMAVSFVLWLRAIGQLGIGISSMHMNATAFYVMIFAWILGAAWIWMQALGALIVAVGVLIAQGVIPLGSRRAAA